MGYFPNVHHDTFGLWSNAKLKDSILNIASFMVICTSISPFPNSLVGDFISEYRCQVVRGCPELGRKGVLGIWWIAKCPEICYETLPKLRMMLDENIGDLGNELNAVRSFICSNLAVAV